MTETETYRFKKGQKLHLDDIYHIQGLAEGGWWTAHDCFDGNGNDEDVTITEDITIKITVTRKPQQPTKG